MSDERLWGVHFLAYLPTVAQVILTVAAVAVIAVIWKTGGFLPHPQPFPAPQGREPKNPPLPAWLLGLVAGIMFLVFRAATPLLGDGQLWLNELEAGAETNPEARAPLLLGFLKLIYPLLQDAVGMNAHRLLRLLSVFSGIATLLAWLRLGRILNVPVTLVLLTGAAWGGIALFFGYVEMYPPAVAAMSWMLVLMVSASRSGKRGEAVAAVTMGLLAFALNALAIVLMPALILFILHRLLGVPLKPRAVAYGSAVLLVICAGVYFAFGWHGGTDILLPLLSPESTSAENPAGLSVFSLRHWADLLNTLLLSVGALGVLMLWAALRRRTAPPEWPLLLPALIFPLAALIVHNPQLGGARDWDIAATLLTVIPVLAILAWSELTSDPNAFRGALALCGTWLLLVIVPWIAVQHSEATSIVRFRDLLRLEPGTSPSGWDYLGSYYTQRADYAGWAECAREAAKVSPNPRYRMNLAGYYALNANWPEAERELHIVCEMIRADSVITEWERRIADPEPFRELARDYRKQGRAADAERAEQLAELIERETKN